MIVLHIGETPVVNGSTLRMEYIYIYIANAPIGAEIYLARVYSLDNTHNHTHEFAGYMVWCLDGGRMGEGEGGKHDLPRARNSQYGKMQFLIRKYCSIWT